MEKHIKHLVVYLDIDGVLSNQKTYAEYHEMAENHEFAFIDKGKLTDMDVITFNNRKDTNIGLFCNGNGWGEIFDKRLVSDICDAIRACSDTHEVIIVSSAANILNDSGDTTLLYNYFSGLWGINITGHYALCGSLYRRYLKMVEHSFTNKYPNNTHFILIDDLSNIEPLTLGTKGICHIRHGNLKYTFNHVLVDAIRNRSLNLFDVEKLYEKYYSEEEDE